MSALIVGLTSIAIEIPKTAAKTEVTKYQRITVVPTFPDFFSGSAAAPAISEKKMIGTTTILSIAIMIVPNGSRISAARRNCSRA